MQNFNTKGDLLVSVDQVVRISYDGSSSGGKIESDGTLFFIHIKESDTVILKHNDFLYALNKDIPIFTNTRPSDCYYGKRYVVPYRPNNQAFVFEEHIDAEKQKSVEYLFNKYSKLLFANDGFEPEWIDGQLHINEKVVEGMQRSQTLHQQEESKGMSQLEPGEVPMSKKIGNVLSFGGDLLKKGLKRGGELLGTGIRKTSGLWKKVVGKNDEPVKVEKTTIDRIKATNKASNTIFTFTANQIQNLTTFAFDLGTQAKDEIMKTDKAKQMKKNKYFIPVMNVGKAALHLLGGVYSGLEQAFVAVAGNTKDMTASVLDYKYGKDVKDAFNEGAGVAGNIYKIQRAPMDALENEVFERTKSKNQKFNSMMASKLVHTTENKVTGLVGPNAKGYEQYNNSNLGGFNQQFVQQGKNSGVDSSSVVPDQRWKWG